MSFSPKIMERVERFFVRRLVLDAIHAGYSVTLDDVEYDSNSGEDDYRLMGERNIRKILRNIFQLGQYYQAVRVEFEHPIEDAFWVVLIIGNGLDVISDYSTNAVSILDGVNKLMEEYA